MGESSETTRVIERDRTVEALRRLAAGVGRGEGRLVLLSGEAGIGKTTVVGELCRGLSRSMTVLRSGCDPLSVPAPLGPLLEVSDELGLDADDLRRGADRGAAFAHVVRGLVARPTVWVIEDVHWADGATADLLRFLARRIERTQALILLTYRTDEIDAAPGFRSLLGELARSPLVRRIELPPLTVDGVCELAGARAGHVIHELTDGNPFFVTEVLASWPQVVPESVSDAVLGRLDRLGSDERRLVEVASVAPRTLEYESVEPLSGADEELVRRTVATGVLVAATDGLRFRHELARRAVELSIPVPTRRRLHLSMLEHLDQRGVADVARLAHHATRSGDPRSIARWCPRAARAAFRQVALSEAAEMIRATLRHRRLLPATEIVDLLGLLVGRLDATDDDVDDLLDVAGRSGRPAALATAWGAVAGRRWNAGDPSGTRAAIDEALSVAEEAGDVEILADVLVTSASYWMLGRRTDAALTTAERAVALVDPADGDAVVRARSVLGCAQVLGPRPEDGFELLEESVEAARRSGSVFLELAATLNLGSGAGEVRRYDVAARWIDRGIRLSEERGDDVSLGYLLGWKLRIDVERGRWGDAERTAVEWQVDDLRLQPFVRATIDGALGRLGVRRGDVGAVERLVESLETVGGIELQHRWVMHCAVAESAWLAGRLDEAAAQLEGPYEEALATESPWARGELGFWFWRCGGDVRHEGATPFDHHIAGGWREAAGAWTQIGCPYESALARADGPIPDRLRALAELDALGAAPAAARLRRQLRDSGASSIPRGPRSTTRSNPAGLTARQLEVLEAAADGSTNAEIAERLFVSAKTVEHHMSAVLVKLGVTTRREAVRRLAEWPEGG